MPTAPSPLHDALANRFAQILYRCLENVGSTKAAFYLRIKDEEGFRLASHYGFPRQQPPPGQLSEAHPMVQWVQRERRAFVVNNAAGFPELADLVRGSEHPRLLFAPIYDKGEWIGFLVQRDRVRGEDFDLQRDEAPTVAICQELVGAMHELRYLFTPGSPRASQPPQEVPAIPVPVPPSDAMVPASPPPAPAEGAPPASRPGAFLPEQRTFFWEAAALLSSIIPLAAVALWMEEPQELRPLLVYSRLPLSPELTQQVVGHAARQLSQVEEKDLRILTRCERSEDAALNGAFRTYLPVMLMEEGGSRDLMLLFRLEDKPFSEQDQAYIQQVARMLGFHLQEARLHEHYHRAFLSVAHRILATAEGGAPSLRTHSLNTAKLARHFAMRLELPSPEVEAVSLAAILHDVGTLLLDPAVLAKPSLTPEDLARVRTHPVLASTFLKDFRFPFDVVRIIRHHHERWDGKGYPDGLKGEEIPVGSRIISIIEAFEVMSSGNGYKRPMTNREILDELRREASAQFDPAMIAEFVDLLTSRPRPVGA